MRRDHKNYIGSPCRPAFAFPFGNRTHDLRIRSFVTLPTEPRSRTEKIGDDLGGEEKVRVHMNVVLRSTMNTNGQ